ncbi:MAG: hypothetical protein IIY73_01780, partial [Solobacterium sp.]|nr:hypothetical protein [Solobacterium sp.]
MEKTLNELLLEKLHFAARHTRRGHRRPPMMGMHGMMHGPRGHEAEMHKHQPRRLPRERILAMILAKGDEGVHQKELAEEMRINPSSISELIDKLELKILVEDDLDRTVEDCYIGDLLSWVMGRAPADSAWLTVMGNI